MDESIGEMNFNYLLKYVIVGDASVGKSNLLLRYTHGEFREEYQLTIGVEFGSNNIIIDNKFSVFKYGIQQVKKISGQLPVHIIKIVHVL